MIDGVIVTLGSSRETNVDLTFEYIRSCHIPGSPGKTQRNQILSSVAGLEE